MAPEGFSPPKPAPVVQVSAARWQRALAIMQETSAVAPNQRMSFRVALIAEHWRRERGISLPR